MQEQGTYSRCGQPPKDCRCVEEKQQTKRQKAGTGWVKKERCGIVMGKMVFMFPGQGAQYAGMGKDFYEKESMAKQVFDKASHITGLDVAAICFEENDRLSVTEYTQIAMVTVEVAILKVLEERGVSAQAAAGLSLGEYGAIVAAGAMRADTAFAIVRRRGVYMQEAVPTGGAMAAVLGLSAEAIEETCTQTEGIVSVANYNCPGQIVITGEAEAVSRAGEELKRKGAKRVMPLKVSGPFHSQMLTGAGERLRKDLDRAQLLDFSIPYVANLTADYVRSTENIRELLEKQISSPVRWQQSVERLLADGFDTFVEIGPGRTLSSFVKKIKAQHTEGGEITVVNVDKYEDLENSMEVLKNA